MSVSPEILDLQPPCDLEAERAVCGSILHDPTVVDDVAEIVGPQDFHAESCREVFRCLVAMRDETTPIDAALLLDRLRSAGTLERIGGTAVIGEMAQAVPFSKHAVYYARIVRDKSLKRAMIRASTETLRDAYAGTIDGDALLERTEAALSRIAEGEASTSILDAPTAVAATLTRIIEVEAGRQGVGIPVGLIDFDQEIGGLFGGELVILAARPRVGKTSFATQIMTHNALAGRRVLFASLEMSAVELTQRMACSLSGIDGSRLRTGSLSGTDAAAMTEALNELQGAGFSIIDDASLTVAAIRRAARREQRRHGLSLVVVDYIGRVTPPDKRVSRHLQIGEMTGQLKALARELGVPVLVLAQLSRAFESAGNSRPQLSHLRESGSLEQDADMILFLDRPELANPDNEDAKGVAILTVAKNRNGCCGEYKLAFDAPTTSFSTLVQAVEWDANRDFSEAIA